MQSIAILVLAMCSAGPMPPEDVQTLIQRSVEAMDHDWKAAPSYSYSERVRTDGGTRTSEVMMILGSPYERLTQVNGRPLTAEQQSEEQQKLEHVIAQRQAESPEEKDRRVAKYEKERDRDHLFLTEMTRAFDFKLESEQRLGGRDVHVLRATPRPGYHPPNMQAQALAGMQGRLWLDKNTLQWVRVEAEVIHPVNIVGFLARVEPGTRFELEQMPVESGIWLPQHFRMRSRAKILLFSHKGHEEETYWGYRKQDSQEAPPEKHPPPLFPDL